MTVLMCSGQGAQRPQMGADLLDVPEVAETFALASSVLGRDLATLARTGEAEEVNDVLNAQALTATLSVGVGRALMARGLQPRALLGFSLGQVSALALAEVLPLKTAFELLDVRSRALARAAAAHPGAMSALLGATSEQVQEACAACAGDDVLVAANYNCPGQIVVSGTVAAVGRAEEWWKENGGKRVARLNTAGAFHSPLMEQAAGELREFCATLTFAEPRIPVICNTDAAPWSSAEAPERLARHLTHPVLFEQGVRALAGAGATAFVEAGFGGVLVNLVKRIDRTLARHKVGIAAELEAYAQVLAEG